MTFEPGSVVVDGSDRDVRRFAGEDGDGVVERGAARPAFRDARVSRFGQRAVPVGCGTEVGADVDVVLVDPTHRRLVLGERESVGDPGACGEVEFAHHRGVGTAARQRDQHSPIIGAQRRRALPHPVLVLGLGEFVDVDQHVPLGIVGDVGVEGRAAPQAARIGGVAPEVVEVVAAASNVRDAVVGVEGFESLFLDLGEPLRRGQPVDGRGVVLTHPVERGVGGDLLEPQVRVGALGCHRCATSRRGRLAWSIVRSHGPTGQNSAPVYSDRRAAGRRCRRRVDTVGRG